MCRSHKYVTAIQTVSVEEMRVTNSVKVSKIANPFGSFFILYKTRFCLLLQLVIEAKRVEKSY